ncbi:LOW QUALITY PROTEIN: uncharacterized protein LOC117160759 [Bombus vancouverensis nearcticus]|uniref:LOW QUALITY PROTEIN: uncharacterized protein LOC117160759 n=1 Tax=Bombus vancouverensis nearcticus TaxID=2705178 RepID=UPI00402B9558
MEIKSSSNTITENRNAMINITSTFENFPWTALQQSSKGTNIIKAINQLLSMYHPNDGIIAYERVLKALLILSENLDSDLQQQIISMVPLPKGVSNDKIRNLIFKITELIKAPNNKSLCQKITMTPEESNTEILNEDSEIHLNQNILLDTSQNLELHEKFASSVPEVFKGFPPNEISTIHNHVNYMYDTLNYNIPYIKPHVNSKQSFSLNTNEEEESLKLQSTLKWFHTPHLLYKTNLYRNSASGYQQRFFKSMDDKYFQLSIDRFNNWNQCNIANMPYALHQDTTCLKELYKNGIISNKQNKNEIFNLKITYDDRFVESETNCEILHNSDVNKNFKKYSNLNKNKIFDMEVQEHFKQELKNEQAIQQDIYKMDVVYCEEERKDTIINIQMTLQTLEEENLMVHKKLKTSLQNFLKRVEQETLIMAVANSLGISSVENFTKYDPYYSNHSYQEQQLLQRGPLIVNPQFAVHAMTQSKLSNIHNTPYAWMKYNSWKHPTMKQLRLPQQFPFQVSRNKKCYIFLFFHSVLERNSVLHYVKTMDIQCFAQDKSKRMKQSVQRKKLEDIVGKLKEIENSNMNN